MGQGRVFGFKSTQADVSLELRLPNQWAVAEHDDVTGPGDKIQASIPPSVAVPLQVTIGKQLMCGGRILSRLGARTGGPQTAYRTLIWLH